MAVLILAPENDEHALAVGREITRLGETAQILDLGLFPDRATLSMRYGCCCDDQTRILKVDGHRCDFDEFSAVWWRRPAPPRISEQIGRPSHRVFAFNEAHHAITGLLDTLDIRWVNDRDRDQAAHHKPYQLRVAQSVGLTIPKTLMTNDPDEALRFLDARGYRDVIYKAFAATEQEWRETRLLRAEEIELIDQVRHAPLIFQDYIEAQYDLRVTVIGNRIFPAAIYSQNTRYTVDCRIDIANARIAPTELPEDVENQLLALMRRMGLVYGAIDLRLTPDGEYVFLEINPAGQFLYIEGATGLPIAAEMARTLATRDTPRKVADHKLQLVASA